jgi:hypothetical protein
MNILENAIVRLLRVASSPLHKRFDYYIQGIDE